MLASSYTSQEPNPLVNGTLEVLECKGIDQSVIRHRGVWFGAGLED